jgi:hypothetical protein
MSQIHKLINEKRVSLHLKDMEAKIAEVELAIKQEILRVLDNECKTIEKLREISKEIDTVESMEQLTALEHECILLHRRLRDATKCRFRITPLKTWDESIQNKWRTYWEEDTCFAQRDVWDEGSYIDIVDTILSKKDWIKKFNIDFEPFF